MRFVVYRCAVSGVAMLSRHQLELCPKVDKVLLGVWYVECPTTYLAVR